MAPPQLLPFLLKANGCTLPSGLYTGHAVFYVRYS